MNYVLNFKFIYLHNGPAIIVNTRVIIILIIDAKFPTYGKKLPTHDIIINIVKNITMATFLLPHCTIDLIPYTVNTKLHNINTIVTSI